MTTELETVQRKCQKFQEEMRKKEKIIHENEFNLITVTNQIKILENQFIQ